MPSSSPALLTPIITQIMQLDPRPQSVLDVGCGAGKYGVLAREFLDMWDGRESLERRVIIDAVEIHAPYLGPLHKAVYDRVWGGANAVDLLECTDDRYPFTPDGWDLILSVDMIEHLSDADGRRFIAAALRRCDVLLVSTPQNPSDQGAVFGNEHERHVSRWHPVDFEPYGTVSAVAIAGFWIVVVRKR